MNRSWRGPTTAGGSHRPADAGMDPDRAGYGMALMGLPRARGWPYIRTKGLFELVACPARAGMNPLAEEASRGSDHSPRVRGDAPAKNQHRHEPVRLPRARG